MLYTLFSLILYSPSSDKFYTGITQENVENRLEKHSNSTYGNHYTSQAEDWIILIFFLKLVRAHQDEFSVAAIHLQNGYDIVRSLPAPAGNTCFLFDKKTREKYRYFFYINLFLSLTKS